MRRLALLLATLMLAISAGSAAQAQTDPYGAVIDGVEVACAVTTPSTATSPGIVTCVVGGLAPNTDYTVNIVWQGFDTRAASFSASVEGAVAFVGAQSTLTTTINGTTNPNGNDTKPGTIPAGADSSLPATIGLSGTAPDGSIAVATAAINAQATPPTTGGAEETPATGAESGILALISLALVAAGAGAVLMTRRRSQETVA